MPDFRNIEYLRTRAADARARAIISRDLTTTKALVALAAVYDKLRKALEVVKTKVVR